MFSVSYFYVDVVIGVMHVIIPEWMVTSKKYLEPEVLLGIDQMRIQLVPWP